MIEDIIVVRGDWVFNAAKMRTVHIEHVERGMWRITAYGQATIVRGVVYHEADVVTYATSARAAKDKAIRLAQGLEPVDIGIQMRLI